MSYFVPQVSLGVIARWARRRDVDVALDVRHLALGFALLYFGYVAFLSALALR
jgi:hypothetical protein